MTRVNNYEVMRSLCVSREHRSNRKIPGVRHFDERHSFCCYKSGHVRSSLVTDEASFLGLQIDSVKLQYGIERVALHHRSTTFPVNRCSRAERALKTSGANESRECLVRGYRWRQETGSKHADESGVSQIHLDSKSIATCLCNVARKCQQHAGRQVYCKVRHVSTFVNCPADGRLTVDIAGGTGTHRDSGGKGGW